MVQQWNTRHLLGMEGEDPEQANPGEARYSGQMIPIQQQMVDLLF